LAVQHPWHAFAEAPVEPHRLGLGGDRVVVDELGVAENPRPDLENILQLVEVSLDLPLEPTETYSSSPHLFSDLDLPEGSKGRLKASSGPRVEKSTSRPARGGGNSGGNSGGTASNRSAGSMSDKPAGAPRQRARRRTS
jgi:hypothetical protein